MDKPEFEDALFSALIRQVPDALHLDNVRRLSGGASKESWVFNAVTPTQTIPQVLRRDIGGETLPEESVNLSMAAEAKLLGDAHQAGVPVPAVQFVLQESDGLGNGFVMEYMEGETIARKILRDKDFDNIRSQLARQCGTVLAKIHAIPLEHDNPPLRLSLADSEIERYETVYHHHGHPHPVFELAISWLRQHKPSPDPEACLVHGDFRNGNFIVSPDDGLQAVLDWELAHRGDPMEDMGWICVNSWRFGHIDAPVGGFGMREDFIDGYESESGQRVDRERMHFWEVLGTLKWGIMCLIMVETFKSGRDTSVERAASGRRASETELDLLALLTEQ
ncbi:MAG: phosphotransferase family protein [Parvularculales bacterium]